MKSPSFGKGFLQNMSEEIPDMCNLLTGEIPSLGEGCYPDYQTMREKGLDMCNLLTDEIPILG